MVPEIWSMTDRTLCNFGPFLPFYAPKNPKNLNFQKIKNTPEDTIILQKCTKIHDHMPHRSWDTLHNRCNSYFLFWAISCHVTLLTTKKSKFLKNGKKKQNKTKSTWRYHQFTHVHQKIMITWCTVPEMWCETGRQTDEQMDGKSDI